jgi:ribosomal peptide maturation radical SAM protein 1
MADEIRAIGPKVVGFTSTSNQNVPSLVLAKILKSRDPSLAIVFGGANCDGPMGAALHRAFPWVDVVVRGEAERILPDLVRDLVAGRAVRPQAGLCFREGERAVTIPQATGIPIAMDEIPTPTFDEYFERLAKTSFAAELQPKLALVYETARGCWWGAKSHCTFCGLNGSSMAFRSKSPARILEEVTTLAGRYRLLDFDIVDNILDFRYFRNVLPQLRELGYDLRLFYETKSNLQRDQVQLLRSAGVDRIQPGIESLSTPILTLMRKGVTAFQNVRLLKWCAEYGIHPSWNILYGLPGEPPDEYARMAQVVPSLTHFAPPVLGPIELSRFSPYHERPDEFGIEILGPSTWYRYVYDLDESTLIDLALIFEYRYSDGRVPDTYVSPLRREIEAWRDGRATSYRALRYRRGPGFLVIQDRRPNLERADYSFDDTEARIYLACRMARRAAAHATPGNWHDGH